MQQLGTYEDEYQVEEKGGSHGQRARKVSYWISSEVRISVILSSVASLDFPPCLPKNLSSD